MTSPYTHFGSSRPLPEQGWKVHASCAEDEHARIHDLARALAEAGFTGKVLSTAAQVRARNWGHDGLEQIGKVLTLYPRDDAELCRAVEWLARWTTAGPAVVGELSVAAARGVYVRFGSFALHDIDAWGRRRSLIRDPDGARRADVRGAPAPVWAKLPVVHGEALAFPDIAVMTIAGDDYLPLELLHASPRSRVYLAFDFTRAHYAALKWAQRGVAADGAVDAVARLEREYALLRRLVGRAPVPLVYGLERHAEWAVVAMAYVEGVPLPTVSLPVRRAVYRRLLDLVETVGTAGVRHGDIRASNVLVDAAGGPHLIDWELGSDVGEPAVATIPDRDGLAALVLASEVGVEHEAALVLGRDLGPCVIDRGALDVAVAACCDAAPIRGARELEHGSADTEEAIFGFDGSLDVAAGAPLTRTLVIDAMERALAHHCAGLFTGAAGWWLLGAADRCLGRDETAALARRVLVEAGTHGGPDLYGGAAGALYAVAVGAAVGRLDRGGVRSEAAAVLDAIAGAVQWRDGVPCWPQPQRFQDPALPVPLGAAHGSAGIIAACALWTCYDDDRGRRADVADWAGALETHLLARGCEPSLGVSDIATSARRWCHGAAGHAWCLGMLREAGISDLYGPALAARVAADLLLTPEVADVSLCHGLGGVLNACLALAPIVDNPAIARERARLAQLLAIAGPLLGRRRLGVWSGAGGVPWSEAALASGVMVFGPRWWSARTVRE